eukprot:CAMPEP_0185732386 /NCGR_PEP_ID=MMETSP1171-20130828/15982_1 /TAXON_ID=374046 /ORGANISM="Helicotheca tamensis, Strain CCMP826" /LENGTH=193 /DNA_ID=CAMNT_0028401857 /DNA_START=114 /DNA_END=691 /DNA_ORIENTATION=+
MAEGWAHEWVHTKREEIHQDFTENGNASARIERLRSFLGRVRIASVALDATAIYKECSREAPIEKCCGDTCNSTRELKVVKEKAVHAMAEDGIDISRYAPKCVKELLPSLCTNLSSSHADKKRPVDKLVLLCSCGDEVKRDLVRQSKSVEEWNVDAPTALSKGPEGESAYRRVSHEIRREVDSLMERLTMDDG